MKTLQLTFLALLAVCFTSCSGNNKAQTLADEILEKLQQVPDIVAEVTDVESAKSANKKLDDLATELVALDNQIKEVKVTVEKKEELDAGMERHAEEIFMKVGANIEKITATSPEAATELSKGIENFLTRLQNGK